MKKSSGRREQRLLAHRNRNSEGRKQAWINKKNQQRAARGLLK